LYHVVAGEALSSSLSNGQTITTLQGQDVTVSITGGNVFINDAQVTVADLVADNGVVHVIDAVLTPSISVNETMIQSSMIYPNPASDLLNISTPGLKGSTKFEIYNVTGKLMFGGSLTEMSNSISVATLAQGMYQLKLTNGNEAVSHSFLKN
ncbi:MAG: fasciclin domain-containing protein, partial [Flavobacteriales bacterium]